MIRHSIETGSMLAESGPEADRVFLKVIVAAPWWMFWRSRVVTCILQPGQARTIAAALNQAVHKLDTKRNGERRIIVP